MGGQLKTWQHQNSEPLEAEERWQQRTGEKTGGGRGRGDEKEGGLSIYAMWGAEHTYMTKEQSTH